MKKLKVMPCGFQHTGRLKDHLKHHRQCDHPACKERSKKWDELCQKWVAESIKATKGRK
jgi:hypothetical protein